MATAVPTDTRVRHNGSNLLELHRLVNCQTQLQVSDLAIRQCDGMLVVTGRSPTYYVKQLVTQAILGRFPSVRLANEIDVG